MTVKSPPVQSSAVRELKGGTDVFVTATEAERKRVLSTGGEEREDWWFGIFLRIVAANDDGAVGEAEISSR